MAKARIYIESETVERPPAFQEYATQALTTEAVRLMSLAERGLFATMRWYCWANDSIPAEPAALARALGLGEVEVREHLSQRVLEFFRPADDDPDRLVCPGLVRQMTRQMERRAAQAKAGRDSARKRREKRNPALTNRDAQRHALEKSRTEKSRTELGKDGANSFSTCGRAGADDEFVRQYERAEADERVVSLPGRAAAG